MNTHALSLDLSRLAVFEGRLEPTRTWARRWWKWFVLPFAPCDGFLLVGQVAEKSFELDEAVYGVQEVPSRAFGYRTFAVKKLTAVTPEEALYTTSVSARGSTCTCRAGQCRVDVCKHRSGLEAIIAAGILPRRPMQGA